MTAIERLSQVRELHINRLNDAIDALINLEEYYEQFPLSEALDKLNHLRNIAEEEIEEGDKVFDSVNNQVRVVGRGGVGAVNLFFSDEKGEGSIGAKFCFKVPR